jgi:hypothetical protein
MYFLIFSFCTFIIYINSGDDPEVIIEDGIERYICDDEHIDDFITDDKNRHPNITTIDNDQKTTQIFFTEVCG